MTYRELRELLHCLNDDQLGDTITIFNPVSDEYTIIDHCEVALKDDVLDANHFFLVQRV